MPWSSLTYASGREILNALPANAAVVSTSGDIKAVNLGWMRFADANGLRSPNYAVGANYFEICEQTKGPDEEHAVLAAHMIRRVARGSASLEDGLVYPCHSPSEKRWFRMVVVQLGARPSGASLVMHENVTQLINDPPEVHQSSANLDRAAAIISHDLRAPLQTIGALIELFRRESTLDPADPGWNYLDLVQAASSRLSDLVSEWILHLRVTQHTEILREPVSLDDVLREVRELIAEVIKNRKASIEIQPLGKVTGNRLFLLQLFQNLIVNALVHNPPERTITVGVETRAGERHFYVRDNGRGISAEVQSHIFEPFTRSRDSSADGLGLGLSICSHVVGLHRGRLFVESEEGKGSTFYFTLPG